MPTLTEYKERLATHFNTQDAPGWNWVFYGDSITHGAAHTHGWRSFPEIFHERVRWELKKSNDIVINTAYSGQTAFNLSQKEYFTSHVSRFSPDAVFLLIGTNDIVKTEIFQKLFFRRSKNIIGVLYIFRFLSVLANHSQVRSDAHRSLPH